MKVKIASEAASHQAPYENLWPLVEKLLANGNEVAKPFGGHIPDQKGFYLDRDGWRCDLLEKIDFDLIDRAFDLPDTIKRNRLNNAICDDRSWIQIRGNVK